MRDLGSAPVRTTPIKKIRPTLRLSAKPANPRSDHHFTQSTQRGPRMHVHTRCVARVRGSHDRTPMRRLHDKDSRSRDHTLLAACCKKRSLWLHLDQMQYEPGPGVPDPERSEFLTVHLCTRVPICASERKNLRRARRKCGSRAQQRTVSSCQIPTTASRNTSRAAACQ